MVPADLPPGIRVRAPLGLLADPAERSQFGQRPPAKLPPLADSIDHGGAGDRRRKRA